MGLLQDEDITRACFTDVKAMPDSKDISWLRDEIRSRISGIVDISPHMTRYYSVDASSYIIKPDIIVIPDSVKDVTSAIKVARKHGMPVTPRGGGTGLVGGALNTGLILDMRNINGIKISEDSATVGAGVSMGALDRALEAAERKKHGQSKCACSSAKNAHPCMVAMFAPNPSVGPFCTIGGMIGNNAAGSRSLKYGATINNVRRITMVNGTGKVVTLPDDREIGLKVLEIARRIDASMFPKVSKNSSGYRLDAVTTIDSTHKAIVGSEGTLGVIVSAELKIIKRPRAIQAGPLAKLKTRRNTGPLSKAVTVVAAPATLETIHLPSRLYILEYETHRDMVSDCIKITHGTPHPLAVEFVDKTILDNIKYRFKDSTRGLLFVEYDDSPGRKDGGFPESALISHAAAKATSITHTTDRSEIERWWRYRDASLHYSLTDIDEDSEELIPHVIEDAAVPVESLCVLFSQIRRINEKYNTRAVMYGHAGNGNIHVRLVSQKGGIGSSLPSIASEYFKAITASGGTITGEHGDGLARSEFVSMQYGTHNRAQFAKIKSLFDPSGIMNPGKIITDKTGLLTQNLWDVSRYVVKHG